jgi:hypothetical protein
LIWFGFFCLGLPWLDLTCFGFPWPALVCFHSVKDVARDGGKKYVKILCGVISRLL